MMMAPIILRARPRVLRADTEELAMHERRLDALDKSASGKSIWRQLN